MVSFTPSDTADYGTATGTTTINVDKATPTISWLTPAAITYGTALSGTQLDATSSWTVGTASGPVAGTFAYTPASGTVLSAGASQTLSVSFTPSDTADYGTATQTATIDVDKATPTVSWATPADITYGTALSGTQLDAASSWTVGTTSGAVAGTFSYSPGSGAVLSAGAGQTLLVSFTPSDTADYGTASGTTTINVDRATLTVTGITASNKTYNGNTTATLVGLTSASLSGVLHRRRGDAGHQRGGRHVRHQERGQQHHGHGDGSDASAARRPATTR